MLEDLQYQIQGFFFLQSSGNKDNRVLVKCYTNKTLVPNTESMNSPLHKCSPDIKQICHRNLVEENSLLFINLLNL